MRIDMKKSYYHVIGIPTFKKEEDVLEAQKLGFKVIETSKKKKNDTIVEK